IDRRSWVRFHRVVGGEIVFREEPRACGDYDSYYCSPLVAAADVDGDGVPELLAYDHAPGSPKHTYLSPRRLKRVGEEWALAGRPLPDFKTGGGGPAGFALGDLGFDTTPGFVFG